MKKVFLSVPMKGRNKEDIESSLAKMKAVTTAYLGEEVEFINTNVEDKPPYVLDKEHSAVWYLGKSLQIMSQCDLLVTVDLRWRYPGCCIEYEVATSYGLSVLELDSEYVAPDVHDYWRAKNAVAEEGDEIKHE